jgi:hypothetical protein
VGFLVEALVVIVANAPCPIVFGLALHKPARPESLNLSHPALTPAEGTYHAPRHCDKKDDHE